MTKPKHKRCAVCDVVTSRYSCTTMQGPFAVKVWVRDERHGSVQGADGKPYCDEHAVEAEFAPAVPEPTESVKDALLRRATADESLDDDTFAVLSRALRGVDPAIGGAE
jgi:hypothetical protein